MFKRNSGPQLNRFKRRRKARRGFASCHADNSAARSQRSNSRLPTVTGERSDRAGLTFDRTRRSGFVARSFVLSFIGFTLPVGSALDGAGKDAKMSPHLKSPLCVDPLTGDETPGNCGADDSAWFMAR